MPRRTDSGNPADWLAIAATELQAVDLLAHEQCAFDLCQSKLAEGLEKILKAELIRRGWRLEKTHDLERLRKELQTRDPELADGIRQLCASLAEAYFAGRYPGFDLDEPDWAGLRSKHGQVTALLAKVRERLAPASGG